MEFDFYTQQGYNRKDALSKIVAKHGENVFILKQKNLRIGGIFGLFAREGVEIEYSIPKKPPLKSEESRLNFEENKRKFEENKPKSEESRLNFEENKRKVLAASGKDPEVITAQAAARIAAEAEKENSQKVILDTLQEIKQTIEAGSSKNIGQEDHPSLKNIRELLKLNDFSEHYIEEILARCRKELPLDTLENFDEVQDRVLEWIGESISIYRETSTPRKGRIMVLVGPTGVGKTTTIAKLAAIFGIANSGREALSVRMITIDAFRIGAKAQIEAYGSIMGFPVAYIDKRQDLRKEINLYSEVTDLFLVDTFGKSPHDSVKLGEMKELLEGCGPRAEVHLVISAGTKTSDIAGILQQFEPFNYRSVVLTKLDETRHIGSVISVLSEKRKSVSYITDGQSVPNDIKKASVVRFLLNMEEFKIDRDKIEKRFPVDEADHFQWGYH